MKVRLADEAEADLEAIGDEIAKDSPARAASFVAELRERCLGLGRFPKRFPLVSRYEQRGVRHCHGNYLIFYRVEAEAAVVIHIIHGAMDYSRILFPLE